jgi:hypothetical protein
LTRVVHTQQLAVLDLAGKDHDAECMLRIAVRSIVQSGVGVAAADGRRRISMIG